MWPFCFICLTVHFVCSDVWLCASISHRPGRLCLLLRYLNYGHARGATLLEQFELDNSFPEGWGEVWKHYLSFPSYLNITLDSIQLLNTFLALFSSYSQLPFSPWILVSVWTAYSYCWVECDVAVHPARPQPDRVPHLLCAIYQRSGQRHLQALLL